MTTAPVAAEPAAQTIDEVLTRMKAIEAALPVSDGVACFNRMYLDVTDRVRNEVSTGCFGDADFMAQLDVVFANLYFDAVNAISFPEDEQPVAWRPLLRHRSNNEIQPLQFALAGMNVHINHDLPVAVVRTCLDRSTAPEDGGHHADYQKIDALLANIEPAVRESFEPVIVRSIDKRLATVANTICDWSINRARDVAWDTALGLWAAREHATLNELMSASLARAVEAGTMALLVSL